MGDNYNIGNSQVGAIGKNANATNISFNGDNAPETDYIGLREELIGLLEHVSGLKLSHEQEKDVDNIKRAIVATEGQEPAKAKTILKGIGRWVQDVAKEIGAKVFAELIFR
ncbi:hypothetical protein ACX0G9_25275 [Flavitalea flava]